jgi:hypothetical protein
MKPKQVTHHKNGQDQRGIGLPLTVSTQAVPKVALLKI